ncbi:MAG: helix-turn-helix domain-containing protein, partial [Flavobacteriaceae bacterium]
MLITFLLNQKIITETITSKAKISKKPIKKLCTQSKLAKNIGVTFQQIQKYEKGTNGVSSIRLLQLSNYLKVPINYFFEDFSEYLINLEKSQEGHMNVNYNFLTKLYSELSADQKLKFNKSLQIS